MHVSTRQFVNLAALPISRSMYGRQDESVKKFCRKSRTPCLMPTGKKRFQKKGGFCKIFCYSLVTSSHLDKKKNPPWTGTVSCGPIQTGGDTMHPAQRQGPQKSFPGSEEPGKFFCFPLRSTPDPVPGAWGRVSTKLASELC